MMVKLLNSRLLRSIGLYSFFNLLNSAVPFLLLPILTNHLSRSEYAIVDIFNNLAFIFLPLLGLNIGSSIIRFYYEKEKYNLSVFLSSILIFLTCSSAAFIIVVFSLRYVTHDLFDDKGIYFNILIGSIFYAFFNQIIEILLSLYRAQERSIKYGSIRVSKTLFDFGVSALLIIFVYSGWESRIWGALMVSCVFSGITIIVLVRKMNVRFRYNHQYVKDALNYSSPLIVHSLSGYVLSYANRMIILYFLGLESVGIFSVASQVGMVMSFIGNSVNQAWTPFLFNKLKNNDKSQVRSLERINVAMIVFYILIAVLIYFCVPFIYRFFIGKDFSVSPLMVFYILLGYAFSSCYKIYVNYLFYFKETKKISAYTFLSAIFNIGLCWLFVPLYNIQGAAVATLLSFILLFGMVFFDYKQKIRLYYAGSLN